MKSIKTPIKAILKNGIVIETDYVAQTKTLPKILFVFNTNFKLQDQDAGIYKEIV